MNDREKDFLWEKRFERVENHLIQMDKFMEKHMIRMDRQMAERHRR